MNDRWRFRTGLFAKVILQRGSYHPDDDYTQDRWHWRDATAKDLADYYLRQTHEQLHTQSQPLHA